MWSWKSDRADLPLTLMKYLVYADLESFPNISILLELDKLARKYERQPDSEIVYMQVQ